MSDQKYANKRFLAKMVQRTDQTGKVSHYVQVDNSSPTNADGTPNKYFKGMLIWVDAKTGKQYQVKNLSIGGVPAHDAAERITAKGDKYKTTCSLSVDLDKPNSVKELS